MPRISSQLWMKPLHCLRNCCRYPKGTRCCSWEEAPVWSSVWSPTIFWRRRQLTLTRVFGHPRQKRKLASLVKWWKWHPARTGISPTSPKVSPSPPTLIICTSQATTPYTALSCARIWTLPSPWWQICPATSSHARWM